MLTVPLEAARAETTVVNSRFIASLEPVSSVEEARAFIQRVRLEFPDARHHVPAFVVGGGRSVTEYCSDDGEPSGTAGRPLLAVLKGSGLGDLAVVVTRYFGGTLLGTGGLVKAYSEAGRAVLAVTRRAALVEVERLGLELPYPLFDRFRQLCEARGARVVSEDFGEAVRVEVELASEGRLSFESALRDLSSGTLNPERLSAHMARMPL